MPRPQRSEYVTFDVDESCAEDATNFLYRVYGVTRTHSRFLEDQAAMLDARDYFDYPQDAKLQPAPHPLLSLDD